MHFNRLLRIAAILLNVELALRWWRDWFYVLGYAVQQLHGLRLLVVFTVSLFWDALAPTLALAALFLTDRRKAN